MNWERLQAYITYVIFTTAVVGFGVMIAMWISI